ncbi:DUF1445-domain-containing protein [Mytilinidion resinicola]|uniref:DUF1445-domain-containing protein n=1 Tax=Mytilinidion resinicola TaxID=574789 RepID=A0A6A6Y0S3_9PEZI|nr:DUF1445-domain-containing protein [Mytilinidion resinicola]KAF2801407.1 DUF1445-domain-containing protein [Mytilinidion resinicola]
MAIFSDARAEDTRPIKSTTGADISLAARTNALTSPTSGLAPTFLQANLVILPSRYASDFRLLCARNPVPCPLIAESISIGCWSSVTSFIPGLEGAAILSDCDIRRDVSKYIVYKNSKIMKQGCLDILDEWTDDYVALLIGCSFSFESALIVAGLPPRHTALNRNVPIYRTNIPLCPAGVFTGSTYVVSMRSYKASEVEKVREITRPYTATHGEPIAWGWGAVKRLGIEDIDAPTWGEPPLTQDGRPLGEVEGKDHDVPVFWGCGVTPMEAVARSGLEGVVMTHDPGHMLLLDCRDSDIVPAACVA